MTYLNHGTVGSPPRRVLSLQLPQEPGIVIEIKRANYKVLYGSDNRAWVPRDVLVIVPPAPDSTPLPVTLHFLLRRVNAHECELSTNGVHHLSARIDEIDHTTVDEIRAFLGQRSSR